MTRPRIQDWSKPEKLILLRGWRMNGLTIEQVADNIGIGKTTIYEWMKKNPNIANALKIGADEALMIAENALFTLVKKNNLGAIIFFLKNRSNGKWRDGHDIYTIGPEEVTESFSDKLDKYMKGKKNEKTDKE